MVNVVTELIFTFEFVIFWFSGHIGITVDDTYKACERFEQLGVEFVKKPTDGETAPLDWNLSTII